MSRQKFEKTFNTFTKGLMTEASELNFPEDFSLYEKNFLLHRDGGRDRRKGMELMYPLGMILTSGLYPIEFDDSIESTPTGPTARYRQHPDDNLSVHPIDPIVAIISTVRYREYEMEPEGISVAPLSPTISRETVTRYFEASVGPESLSVQPQPPTVSLVTTTEYLEYSTPPETLTVSVLEPTVVRR